MLALSRQTSRGYLVPASRVEMASCTTWLLERLGLTGSVVELVIVDDAAIASLNVEFMGLAGPTNVLSFPDTSELACDGPVVFHEDMPPGGASLGDGLEALDTPADCLDGLGDPIPDPDRPLRLGAVILSAETCAREALLYGQSTREHFFRLLCHGILHCAGLEHGPEMDAVTEDALEEMRLDEAV